MKTFLKIFALVSLPVLASAQFFVNSSMNLSESKQSGTARFLGLGGNHAALGGDASTLFGNPAGLAFYNRSELSISPVIYNNSTSTNYASTNTSAQKGNFNIGHLGLIFAGEPQNPRSNLRRTTFGVSYSRLNNLNNQFHYAGTNNASSFIDWAVENTGNLSFDVLDKEYNPRTNLAQSINSAAFNLFLFDDTTPNGPPYRKAIPLKGAAAIQDGTYQTSGSTGQWTFAYSGNFDDKLYIGGSVGLWKADYEYQHALKESYANALPFKGINYNENLTLTGGGMNISGGFIYKPTSNLQVGGYITSPTFASLQTTFNESIGVDLTGDIPVYDAAGKAVKNAAGQQQYTKLTQTTIPVEQYDFEYNITTPLKASGGATFFIGKKGFITASADYVGYQKMKLSTTYYNNSNDNLAFKTDNQGKIKNTFNNVVNYRVGGEARLGYFRVRGGAAFLPDPYKTSVDNIDRSRFQFSGGLGIRNEKYFVDAAATFMQSKEAYTPYQMNDVRRTPSALISNTGLNFAVSAGVLF